MEWRCSLCRTATSSSTRAAVCATAADQLLDAVTLQGTRGEGDFVFAARVDGDEVRQRISHVGRVFVLPASTDGAGWHFVRAFVLGDDLGEVKVGFEGQSPTGDGCAVWFDRARFERTTLGDLPGGS